MFLRIFHLSNIKRTRDEKGKRKFARKQNTLVTALNFIHIPFETTLTPGENQKGKIVNDL